jgi:hypothetical protein
MPLYGVLTEMPSEPAMMTAVDMPQNSPWSTTPHRLLSSLAAATGSAMGLSKMRSTM